MRAPLLRGPLGHRALATLLLLASGCVLDTPTPAGEALTTVSSFGSNPGALRMYYHAPASAGAGAPLVVALHGCTQTAAAYVGAGWNALAEAEGFYVLYPEQQTSNNGARCFSWFEGAETRRGSGEVASIAQMIEWMRVNRGIDPTRVYVTGLSAGGGMTTALLAAYPELFAAGAVMAGLPAGCANSIGDSYTCQSGGVNRTPEAWATLVRGASSHTGPWPRVSVWNGSSDTTVSPNNLTEIAEQWLGVAGVDTTADREESVGRGTRRSYTDASGRVIVETWLISSMGHGTAIAPSAGCGTAGAFLLDVGICSTRYAAAFFGLTSAPMASDAGPATDTGARDAGSDAGRDAGSDAGSDAGRDAGTDAGRDAGLADAGADAGRDAGLADAGLADAGSDAGAGFTCRETNASNYAHVTAARGTRCGSGGSYVCTVGSGQNIGLWSLGVSSWVREVRAGYFEAGRCP